MPLTFATKIDIGAMNRWINSVHNHADQFTPEFLEEFHERITTLRTITALIHRIELAEATTQLHDRRRIPLNVEELLNDLMARVEIQRKPKQDTAAA
jgi:hypothetical protein